MRRAARLRILAVAIAAACAATAAADARERLQPYQMVRSLQLVQDRIAAGDHAAMPMQVKLLEMIDTRFRNAGPGELVEPRNIRALLVFGMSGGNPATIRATVARTKLDATDKAVAEGVVAYLGGRPAAAIKAFEPVDPMKLPADLAAFVALVKGSLASRENPAQALRLLDEARLLSPGTLVEEAALRRSIGIATETGDAARFALASTQYAARFLHSPYASQFADSFVSGVIALRMAIGTDKIADITAMMDAEREKVVYLRIARRAAIDGLAELSAFASTRAEQGRGGKDNRDDPRALLYASLSSMTSAKIDDLRATLKQIDRSRLSTGDRSLLDAARQVAREMTAAPAVPAAAPMPPSAPAAALPAIMPDAADTAGLPLVEGIESERPAVTTAAAAPAQAPIADVQPAPKAGNDADNAIARTRRRLNQIDQLLGASPL